MNDIDNLNDEQRQAVLSTRSPLIVIAGPGTGKTKTLVSKINYLIQVQNVSPSSIIAFTFTKKAVNEIIQRLSNPTVSVTTFHGFSLQILKQQNMDIHVISEDMRREFIASILETHDEFSELKKIPYRELSLLISNSKNSITEDKILRKICDLYNTKLQKHSLVDFDDMLIKAQTFLSQKNSLLDQVQNKYKYILVDEFQDTNPLQYQLVKILLGPKSQLFLIGDPYQSIYSFRGANSKIFDVVKHDFPLIEEIVLPINYRSDKSITEVSKSLFGDKVDLENHSKDIGEVDLIETLNEYAEADWIINSISEKMGGMDLIQSGIIQNSNEKNCFSDFAVIYRTHSLNRILKRKFQESGIPFQIIGDESPYSSQRELSFFIKLLKYIYLNDLNILHNILTSNFVGINPQSSRRIIDTMTQKKLFDIKTFSSIDVTDSDKKKLQLFTIHLKELEYLKNKSIQKLFNTYMNIFKIKEIIDSNQDKKIDMQQFQSILLQFEAKHDPVNSFLEYVKQLEENEFYDTRSDKVTLMTIHASKGLEFKYVFIPGFEDGTIPFHKSIASENIEEEKRLLYVGMTRAKHGLYLCYAKNREKNKTDVSRFKQLIQDSGLREFQDPSTAIILRKIQKNKDKKSQLSLF